MMATGILNLDDFDHNADWPKRTPDTMEALLGKPQPQGVQEQLAERLVAKLMESEAWDESDHPRASDGKFTGSGGASGSGKANLKNWFGASKVTNADGSPKVVYHGTSSNFTQFDPSRRGQVGADYGVGLMFFTDDPQLAADYAEIGGTQEYKDALATYNKSVGEYEKIAASVLGEKYATFDQDREKYVLREANDKLDSKEITRDQYDSLMSAMDAIDDADKELGKNMSDPWSRDDDVGTRGANIMPVHLKMENPKEVDANGMTWDMVLPFIADKLKGTNHDGIIVKNVIDSPKSEDYEMKKTATIYAVLNPDQIKSATGNRGSFNPSSQDIREQAAERIVDLVLESNWDESKHPRAKGGKFARKGTPTVKASGDKEQPKVAPKAQDSAQEKPPKTEAKPDTAKAFMTEWEAKPVPDRIAAWSAIDVRERDQLADAPNTVNSRRDEHLDGLPEFPNTGDLMADVTTRVTHFKDRIADESLKKFGVICASYTKVMEQAGVKPELARELVTRATDLLAAQEMEAMARSLGDHGVHHIGGNVEMANDILAAHPGKDRAQDLALMMTAQLFHDTGYLTPPSRSFMDEGHPRWSAQYFREHLADTVSQAFGKHAASEVEHLIRTHDTRDIDWTNDPIGSAVRIADNTALFHEEKIPGLLRYAPDNIAVLKKLADKQIDLNAAREELKKNVQASKVPDHVKSLLTRAAAEVSPVTPKFVLGMMGGQYKGVGWSDGHLVIDLEPNEFLTKLHQLGDFGQRQFAKFAEAYGVDPEQFKKTLEFSFKRPDGTTLLEGRISKKLSEAIAIAIVNLVMEMAGDWDEGDHPRDDGGRFARKGESDQSATSTKEYIGQGYAGRNVGAILSPSAKEPGKWQVTRYDDDGFSGDTTYDSRDQAMKELDQDGYSESDKISLIGQLAGTDRFQKGTDATKAIAWINELGMVGDREGANLVQDTFREQGTEAALQMYRTRIGYKQTAEPMPDMEVETYLREREKSDRTTMLTPYTPDKLRETGNQIYGVDGVMYMLSPSGDVQGVVNVSGKKGSGRRAIVDAIARGAKTLDCFEVNSFLPKYYARFGFREVGREKFNREYAPANWNYERDGEPDVVFMVYDEELSRERSEVEKRSRS